MKIRLDDLIVLLSAGIYVYKKVDSTGRGIYNDGDMNKAISNVMRELRTISLVIDGEVTPEIRDELKGITG